MPKYFTIPKIIFFSLIISLLTISPFTKEISAQTKEEADQFYYIEGLRQYNIGSLEEAQKIFKELIKRGTKNDAVYYYSANISLQKGDIANALKMMATASKMDPQNYWYSVQLAKIYAAQNNLDEAIKIYETLQDKYPQKTELYDDMIDIYIAQKQIDKARKVVDDVERYVGKNEATGLTRYNLLVYENKKQEAFDYLIEFDKEYSTPRTATLLGDYYSGKQKDTIALDYYRKAFTLDPTYVPASFGMAEIFRTRGQFDLYFEKIFPFLANPAVDSKMKVSYMKEILSSQKFVQTFLPQVDTMMANLYTAHPSDTSVAYTYALYLVQTGRLDPGLKVLDNNLRVHNYSKEAHRQYLSLLYYMERWNKLVNYSDSALAVLPKDPDFMELKGIGLLQLKRIHESIEIFKQLLKLTKGDSASTVRNLSILGDLNYQIGNKNESFKYYRKTLSKEPNHLTTLNNYAYYLSEERKDLKRAYKMSKKTIEADPNNPTCLDTFAWILHLLNKDVEARAIFKHAMIYGGGENATILDHYAEVLYALKEYDLAYIYWAKADKLDPSLGIAAKMAKKRGEAK
ncbi:MAG: tetratricopeptide repeat protein [Rikenellaceae bacterium]